ncbi:MAG: hypothetical protein M3256_17815 [Actinomycetota bacterium]|nr:hypothetical protein [Actinomycetota bacterium]
MIPRQLLGQQLGGATYAWPDAPTGPRRASLISAAIMLDGADHAPHHQIVHGLSLGIHTSTAVRWVRAGGGDWTGYVAARANSTRRRQT